MPLYTSPEKVPTLVCRTIVSTVLVSNKGMTSKIAVKFGNKVRAERTKQGLSQEQLASRAGVHRTYVGMIERGEKNITLENIAKIAGALNIALSDLVRSIDR